MYPVIEIECTDRRGVCQKADVIEYNRHNIRVVVQGSDLAINMRHDGSAYVGHQAGLEFICTSTYDDIDAQRNIR